MMREGGALFQRTMAAATNGLRGKKPTNTRRKQLLGRPFTPGSMVPLDRQESPQHNRMRVVTRIRPVNPAEESSGRFKPIVRVVDDYVVLFDPPDGDAVKGVPGHFRRCKDINYMFNRVFGPNSSQYEVYEHSVRDLLPSLLDGFNVTVFAYGATGAGKTHTMVGNQESGPGVMILMMKDLFAMVDASTEKEAQIVVSYLEVYNETIQDLLSQGGVKHPFGLELREDPKLGAVVSGLSEHHPKNVGEVMELLEIGRQNRTTSATEANEVSSRSHAVLQVIVKQKERVSGISNEHITGKLCLIDLAGSERAAVSKNCGTLLKEGANINKSLLALGNCINALGDPTKRRGHIPYRNSKLTRLLKDSLGGNCLTVMIANVNPSSNSYDDTHNTLKYASRASNIKNQVARNVQNVTAHLTDLRQIIVKLEAERNTLKEQLRRERFKQDIGVQSNKLSNSIIELRAEIDRIYEKCRVRSQKLLELQDKELELSFKKRDTAKEIDRWKMERDDVDISKVKSTVDVLENDLRIFEEETKEVHSQMLEVEHLIKQINSDFSHLEEMCASNENEQQRHAVYDYFKLKRMSIELMKSERICQRQELISESRASELSQVVGVMKMIKNFWKEQFNILKENDLVTPILSQNMQYGIQSVRTYEKLIGKGKANEQVAHRRTSSTNTEPPTPVSRGRLSSSIFGNEVELHAQEPIPVQQETQTVSHKEPVREDAMPFKMNLDKHIIKDPKKTGVKRVQFAPGTKDEESRSKIQAISPRNEENMRPNSSPYKPVLRPLLKPRRLLCIPVSPIRATRNQKVLCDINRITSQLHAPSQSMGVVSKSEHSSTQLEAHIPPLSVSSSQIITSSSKQNRNRLGVTSDVSKSLNTLKEACSSSAFTPVAWSQSSHMNVNTHTQQNIQSHGFTVGTHSANGRSGPEKTKTRTVTLAWR